MHLLHLETQPLPQFENGKRERKYRSTKLRTLTLKEVFNSYIGKSKIKILSLGLELMNKHCGNRKYQRFNHLEKVKNEETSGVRIETKESVPGE